MIILSDVVIVDDDPYARSELRAMLESSPLGPLSVVECHSGEQGIRALRRHCPTFLFFDPSLPDNHGNHFQRQALWVAPGVLAIIVTQLKMFDLVYEAINGGVSGYLLKPVLRSELFSLMERLVRVGLYSFSKMPGIHDKTRPRSVDHPIENVLNYVKEHYQEPLTVSGAAARVYLSPSYFSRLFKMETGVTFVEFVTTIRLDHAKELLRTTDIPIEVIAQQTGFGSGSYFATAFRRIEGQAPRDYRQVFQRLYQHKITKY